MFALAATPIAVVAGQTQLILKGGPGSVPSEWHEMLEWDRSGPHDAHYRVNPERGELQSGDGLRGMVLPAGWKVHASYREGGGEAGNVAAKTLQRVPPNTANTKLAKLANPLAVWQPFRATGGTSRETLGSIEARAQKNATRVDKAVTAADFERLALATPGVPVARAHAVPGLHPALPCYPARGAVTLIVVPQCPLPAPRPSQSLLDAVVRYLMPRRLVTSEIHAVAPVYRRIAVHATLQLGCDAVPAEVRKRAVAAVNAFFDPLTGGPDQAGWPIGRTVYRNEVMALLADLDGVLRITDFGLQGRGDNAPRCGNVELCAHELVVPGRHKLQLSALVPTELRRSDPHVCKPS
jgi:predicted phage baseplate assembly protein